MSNKFNLLNKIQQQRAQAQNHPLNNRSSHISLHLILGLSFAMLVLALLVINLRLFYAVNKAIVEKKDILDKLAVVEEIVNASIKQSNAISENVLRLTEKLKDAVDTNTRKVNIDVRKLSDSLQVQQAAITNLVKAKDTLYKRVTELEAKQ